LQVMVLYMTTTYLRKEVMKRFSGHVDRKGGDEKFVRARCVGPHEWSSTVARCHWLSGKFGGKVVMPGFAYSVSIFTAEVMRMICYFSNFPGVAEAAFPGAGCELCFVKSMFCSVRVQFRLRLMAGSSVWCLQRVLKSWWRFCGQSPNIYLMTGVGNLRHACQAWHVERFSMARWVNWNTVHDMCSELKFCKT
jgi:hypothetical protein